MIVIEPAEKYSFAAQRDNGSASRVPVEKMACWKGLRVVEFSLHGIDPIFFSFPEISLRHSRSLGEKSISSIGNKSVWRE